MAIQPNEMEFVCSCGAGCSNTFSFKGEDSPPYGREAQKDAIDEGWLFRIFRSKIHPTDRKHLVSCPEHFERVLYYHPAEDEEEIFDRDEDDVLYLAKILNAFEIGECGPTMMNLHWRHSNREKRREYRKRAKILRDIILETQKYRKEN